MPEYDEEPQQDQREIREIKETLEKALDEVKNWERRQNQDTHATDSTSLPGDPTTPAPINWSAPDDDEDD